jgi:hypothetical protein
MGYNGRMKVMLAGDVESRGLVLAASREPDSFARAITSALEIESFTSPNAWRASVAGARPTNLYVSLPSS